MTRIPGTDLDIRPLVLGANTFGWTADEHDSHTILDAFLGAPRKASRMVWESCSSAVQPKVLAPKTNGLMSRSVPGIRVMRPPRRCPGSGPVNQIDVNHDLGGNGF